MMKYLRKIFKNKVIILIFIIFIFCLYMFIFSRILRVRYITLEFEDLPNSFNNKKIAFAADMHAGLYIPTSHIKKMSSLIMKENPDIILFAGDYIYSAPRWFHYYNKDNVKKFGEGIKDLEANLGKYAVMGNHDNWESSEDVSNCFIENNFKMLDNDILFITNDSGEYISIGGVGDFLTDKVDFNLATMGVKTNDFHIVLSHEPLIPMKIAKENGYNKFIDLFLMGHTHALQISFIPIKIIEFLNKNRDYPLLSIYGNMRALNTKVYVTSGVGVVLLPFRLFSYPEVVIIRLKKKII